MNLKSPKAEKYFFSPKLESAVNFPKKSLKTPCSKIVHQSENLTSAKIGIIKLTVRIVNKIKSA